MSSKVKAADVSSGDVPTLNGSQLSIEVAGGSVKASNGVIHVVSSVILPPTN